ncbi:MAG: hypothetical protein CM15mP68_2420 [Pseudomonadota bacterium]|nr:MAG: hypothetical protein CM15mP68_2420 [Pseudomonadota bacterium]
MRAQQPVGKLPPAINIDAAAGTVVITDGRLLHSTGINHTDTPRIVMLSGMQHPLIRQQENWMLSVRPDVIKRASPKLLQRIGYQATNAAQTNEGHGFGATGAVDEATGAIWTFEWPQTPVSTCASASLVLIQARKNSRTVYPARGCGEGSAGGRSAPVGIGGSKMNP